MKKTLQLFLALIFLVSTLNNVQAQLQNLTYEVRASNFAYYDSATFTDPLISGLKNVIEFDIYIQQTNIPQNSSEIMRFALGQYYINVNWGYNVATPTTADTAGFAKFSYIPGSTDFQNLSALPTNPHVKPAALATDGGAYWPPLDVTNGIRGGYTNLNSNSALGNSSDVQILNVFPGTKVGRYRLKKNVTASWPSPYFESVSHHFRWRISPFSNPNNPNPVTRIFAYNDLFGASTDVTVKGTFIMDTLSIIYPPLTPANLSLNVIIEGLYYSAFNQMARKDSVKVYLRNTTSPYEIIDSVKNIIDSTSFTGLFHFSNLPIDTYYVVLKHFNSLEVWSKSGGEVFINNGTINYDFTTSVSQAMGNNLKLKGNKYCLYSGDTDQDGTIDASDLSMVENDISGNETGHIASDLNGDNYVDASDLSIVINNKNRGISVISP